MKSATRALLVVLAGVGLSSEALAQGATPHPASSAAASADPTLAPPPSTQLRFGRNREHSVGFRVWMWNTPAWMVRIFTYANDDWSGPLTAAPALEYVYRRGDLDIVAGFQYTSLAADPAYMRGKNEGDIAMERVESRLWMLGLNAIFLWRMYGNDWFEFQLGMGVGVSYVGGDLYRTQVYPNGTGGYNECQGIAMPSVAYCDAGNRHYTDANGNRFSEPRWPGDGSVPAVVPTFSIPHLALHFRPHHNIDVRVDGGFGVIGFYGGLATHWVFD